MDDLLETPNAKRSMDEQPEEEAGQHEEEDEQSSEDEDGGLDWSKIPSSVPRPVIPKRGEKDFEPAPGGGSGLQLHVLDRARNAMFDALRATRTINNKAISYAIWHPEIARAHVTVARGIHFSSMGHSVPRPIAGGVEKVHKRLELLPEETIYLVERGALFCWKDIDLPTSNVPGLEDVAGSPMTVQQVYSEMIGLQDLTLEKFQVFAYLKRLGYVVTRTNPPSEFYPTPPPFNLTRATNTPSITRRILSLFPLWTSKLTHLFSKAFDWWKPLRISRWLYHDKNYGSMFRSLRFMPAGHRVPLPAVSEAQRKASPYQIFFNLYKPSTPYRKSSPPLPDFSIVVVNARTTPMPSLHELTALFDVLPELPPPLPRQRRPPPGPPDKQTNTTALSTPSVPQPLYRRLFFWARSRLSSPPPVPQRRPNPFMALKAGKKTIVLAVVDAGSISFFRLGEGAFTEWPMA